MTKSGHLWGLDCASLLHASFQIDYIVETLEAPELAVTRKDFSLHRSREWLRVGGVFISSDGERRQESVRSGMTGIRRATWLPSPAGIRPGRDEVHVWRAALDRDDSEVERLWAALAPDERERAQRFHFDRDRRRFVVGRGVLREILGHCLGLAPELIRFGYNQYGKPSLGEDAGGLRFNASHSASAALYACTHGSEVGVDIELMRDDFASFEVAERFFSPAEVRSLGSLPAHLRTQGFFNCWTRKEAYIKALGKGLSHPLDSFSVSLAPGEPARLISTDNDRREAARWSIVDLKPFHGYAAALAIWRRDPEIQCWDWQ